MAQAPNVPVFDVSTLNMLKYEIENKTYFMVSDDEEKLKSYLNNIISENKVCDSKIYSITYQKFRQTDTTMYLLYNTTNNEEHVIETSLTMMAGEDYLVCKLVLNKGYLFNA